MKAWHQGAGRGENHLGVKGGDWSEKKTGLPGHPGSSKPSLNAQRKGPVAAVEGEVS